MTDKAWKTPWMCFTRKERSSLQWDDVWAGGGKLNFLGKRLKKKEKEILKEIMERHLPGRLSRILDVGCGTGFMMQSFKNLGYKEVMGIDNSPNSINLCETRGLKGDVSLMDAGNLRYSDNNFDMVFSEGLLEHFKDPTAIVKEMCRVSKRFVLVFQPNVKSFMDKLKSFKEKSVGAKWQKEYPFLAEDYEGMFLECGFALIDRGEINFGELIWLLFEAK